ncbi:unknown [Bovine gammaherpesvirus 4]|uniref:Cytoplasmic envelopment protein 3 n=2 Tax=Bovine herpesvirus 4 TaxID=10385 RepID=A0A858PWS7_BHV4|nr:unknown [Bovine gammaherpesvirus 4]AAK07957.1 unknown [Bovine gammaherpesvirus 4]AEL29782.1 hypothetical protein [Bovine gammaherpesvirus 4]QJC19144.1 hypothetical protein [Bovine gammaherpesvirus 4]
MGNWATSCCRKKYDTLRDAQGNTIDLEKEFEVIPGEDTVLLEAPDSTNNPTMLNEPQSPPPKKIKSNI